MLCCVSKRAVAADQGPPYDQCPVEEVIGEPEKIELETYVEDAPPILLPCAICARTFMPQSLEKHSKICERSLTKKRKPFDSAKQRIQGTELAEFLPKQERKRSYQDDHRVVSKPKTSWKENHDDFLRAIRAARSEIVECATQRQCSAVVSSGAPTRSNEQGMCPTCNRHFGIKAYDRHVAWCKERATRVPASPATNIAKERLEARMKYRAPSLKSRRATTREKYSPGSAIALHAGSKNSGILQTNKPKESLSTPSCNKGADSPIKPKPALVLFSRRSGQTKETNSNSAGPMKSRPIDRIDGPREEETSPLFPRNPQLLKRMSFLPVPPLKPPNKDIFEDRKNNIPRKCIERYKLEKFEERMPQCELKSQVKSEEKHTIVQSARSHRMNIVSARSQGNPKLNDMTVNQEIVSMTVQPCKIHRGEELVTWTQIHHEKRSSARIESESTSWQDSSAVDFQEPKEIYAGDESLIGRNGESRCSSIPDPKKQAFPSRNVDREKSDVENVKSWSTGSGLLERSYLMNTLEGSVIGDQKWKPIKHSPRIEFCVKNSARRKKPPANVDMCLEANKKVVPRSSATNHHGIQNSTGATTSDATTLCKTIPNTTSYSIDREHSKISNFPQNSEIFIKDQSIDTEFQVTRMKDVEIDTHTREDLYQETEEQLISLISLNSDETIGHSVDEFGECALLDMKRTQCTNTNKSDSLEIPTIDDNPDSSYIPENEKELFDLEVDSFHSLRDIKHNNLTENRTEDMISSTSVYFDCGAVGLKTDATIEKNIVRATKSSTLINHSEESEETLEQYKEFCKEDENISTESSESQRCIIAQLSKNIAIQTNMCCCLIKPSNIDSPIWEQRQDTYISDKLTKCQSSDSSLDQDSRNSCHEEIREDLHLLDEEPHEIYTSYINKDFHYESDHALNLDNVKKSGNDLRCSTAKTDLKESQDVLVNLNSELSGRSKNSDESFKRKERQSSANQMQDKIRQSMHILRTNTNTLVNSMEVTENQEKDTDFNSEVETIEEIRPLDKSKKFNGLPDITLMSKNNTKPKSNIPNYWNTVSKATHKKLINLNLTSEGKPKLLIRNPTVRILPLVSQASPLINARQFHLPLRPIWSNYVRRRPDFNLVLTGRTGTCKEYNPFLLAEQQMNELLSDTSDQSVDGTSRDSLSNPQNNDSLFPLSHSSAFVKYPYQTSSNPNKRSSLIAPPSEFDDLTSDFSSDSTETNSLSREVFLKDLKESKELKDSLSRSPEKKSPTRELGRRVIIDKSKALGGEVPENVTSVNKNFIGNNERARKLVGKSSPKVLRPNVNRSHSVRAASAPKPAPERKNSNNLSSFKKSPQNKNYETEKASSATSMNSRNNNNYMTLSGSNLSLSSIMSSEIDIKRSNSVFDELMTSFEDDNGSFPSVRSLLKTDSLSMSSPVHGTRHRNGQISDEELSSPESYKRQDHSKFSADSAYSSLNRKYSHHGRNTNDMTGRLEEDHRQDCEGGISSMSKLPKYCHNCGTKFPRDAKFCCGCGLRRLAL